MRKKLQIRKPPDYFYRTLEFALDIVRLAALIRDAPALSHERLIEALRNQFVATLEAARDILVWDDSGRVRCGYARRFESEIATLAAQLPPGREVPFCQVPDVAAKFDLFRDVVADLSQRPHS